VLSLCLARSELYLSPRFAKLIGNVAYRKRGDLTNPHARESRQNERQPVSLCVSRRFNDAKNAPNIVVR
jgi:hypothetical protein